MITDYTRTTVMSDDSDGGYSGSTHMDSDTDPDVPWPPSESSLIAVILV